MEKADKKQLLRLQIRRKRRRQVVKSLFIISEKQMEYN